MHTCMHLNLLCKITHLLPQCQELQTYSSHHRGRGLLLQVKWAALVLARILQLWPASEGVNWSIWQKNGERVNTPHCDSFSTSASVLLCSSDPLRSLNVSYFCVDRKVPVVLTRFSPFLEFVCLELLSWWSCTCKTRDKEVKQHIRCAFTGFTQTSHYSLHAGDSPGTDGG